MNYHSIKRRLSSNLTSKCQVTIPKEIRDAMGLKPHDVVSFSLDKNGNAIISPADEDSQGEHRRARIMKGVEKARRAFKANNVLPEGMTNQEWYELMRGPPAEV